MSRTRKSSILQTQISEPLIVVEEKEDIDREDSGSSNNNSPVDNSFLLSPFPREIRKNSLPTPQCCGITASQVRRLSERSENAVPGPKQVEFLATLSSAPQQSPGGRRHSVVTISRVLPSVFGRSRRESLAGFPSRVLPNRRESIACPPSEPMGSVHNLQLDIMDDIVHARKVRMKLWSNSNEKVCEVQPLDDNDTDNIQRFHGTGRRYSDFPGTSLAPIPSSSDRRASSSTSTSKKKSSGIVCSNTDLISILSSLSTSATEINQQCEERINKEAIHKNTLEHRRKHSKNIRSNSFDIAIIYKTKSLSGINEKTPSTNWFIKRHQPKNHNQISNSSKNIVSTEPGKVLWDERSGSMIDVHALGNAIEVFLRQNDLNSSLSSIPKKEKTQNQQSVKSKNWFSNKNNDSTESCDSSSSFCSTLKDLFVK